MTAHGSALDAPAPNRLDELVDDGIVRIRPGQDALGLELFVRAAFVGRFAPVAVRSPGSARFDVGDLDRLGELGVDPLLPSARPSSLVRVRDGFS
ncbi:MULTISPECIES: hypothetical protein [Streptomyces]|uniref:hypothetical protein n=1 Tax=Streptomyces TaxID=1883 RepID=UPI002DDB5AC3|nr:MULTISPECIES: hypothetical protein [unclassified Streptomyces]WSE01065.1 hypothetical protein OG758_47245 [Streptomyces sp. NBC_01474]